MAPSAKSGSNAAGGSSNSAASLGIGLSSSSSGGAGSGIGLGSLAGVPASVYPTDTIRDVAESVGITGMKESVAAALAADVEYRIREIVQDAIKYMRHSKRDQLKTTDVDAALRARNIEPIYGFLPSSSGRSGAKNPSRYTAGPTFRRVQTASGVPLHYVEDEEIDFDKIIEAGPKIGIGRGVGWGAHWLAIEGVQPAVPQNPSPIAIAEAKGASGFMGPTSTQPSAVAPAAKAVTVAGGDGQAVAKPLVKHILSRELQLYYERLTKSIVSPPPEADEDLDDEPEEPEEPAPAAAPSAAHDTDINMDSVSSPTGIVTPPRPTVGLAKPLKTFAQKGSGNHVRDAGLASLRGDPGLHQLVPYLIQFVGSRVIDILRSPSDDETAEQSTGTAVRESRQISAADNHMLGVLLSTVHAILVNPHIFIEPYLHQMMPSILSILLTSSLAEPELLRQLSSSDDVRTPLVTAGTSSYSLRAHASALLTRVVDTFGSSYPTLKPRVVATLLKALMTGVVPGSSDQDSASRSHSASTREPRASPGTKLGALMALRRLGKASFRILLSTSSQLNAKLGDTTEQSGTSATSLRLLGEWMQSWEAGTLHTEGGNKELRTLQMKPLISQVTGALHALLPPHVAPSAELTGTKEERAERLRDAFGLYWWSKVVAVDATARAALETELTMRSSSNGAIAADPAVQTKEES
ncbi:related to TAF6 - Subunit (60 kDa) of TFIID and SAGA complexes [Melanopsichium pennsylvanicum]|uniref:TBP-associated factor 6 n=2 Tax=Melanopsichium pennsylvanicum TaxID=63383 RepID=A0AAJ4XMW9_9BASI|nr:related to TAF6-Subunit (60 kDa) of TFIID and SAGA complexes [Melanopsichium pennsylvanicum 4]SNX85192.1 related to TAF6 - Subunit (60 kDa) of TFIID and SAGA complexes [Melanopsichium pennsylvanicum]